MIVAAVDVDDETGRWQVLADARLDGITGLAADDAVVIEFNGGCSTTGRRPIVAWDATSGTEIWRLLDRVPLSGDTAQELVHVGDGLATMMSDHRLFVLDASTGEERWSELGAFGGFDVDTDAVVADGVVLAVGATETTALDTTTGEVRWRAPITAGSDRGRVDRRCQPRGRNRPVVTRRRPARAAVQQPWLGPRDRWCGDAAPGRQRRGRRRSDRQRLVV